MSSSPTAPSVQSTRIEEIIKQHKEEVARLREEFGDPREALDRFMLDRFNLQALLSDDGPLGGERRSAWEEDDDDCAW